MFALHSKDKIEGSWKVDDDDFVSPIHDAAESGQNGVLQWLLSPSIGFDIDELTSVCFHVSWSFEVRVTMSYEDIIWTWFL